MFRSQFSNHHQGSITVLVQLCPVRVVSDYVLYIIRHHADSDIICIDVQTTYSHILEYDDARTLIGSNCTSTVTDH
jgi:hypothetical protein